MRLLTMLATTVLLAACVHNTDDFTLFVAESGASLTYYIGSNAEGMQKAHDDPWDTIREKFDTDTNHTGTVKSGRADDPWDTINDSFGKDTSHSGKKNQGNGDETDDPWDTIQEKFFKETTHTGTGTKNGEPDDPWDTITEKFGTETVHTGAGNKNDEPDDPWNKIHEGFASETVSGGKSEEEDPWNRINSLFPSESVHTGKTNDRYFLGFEKSVAVFASFTYEVSTADRARVVEVRGNVLKLEFADGVVQYVIDAPATWTEGTQLVTGFVDATSKKDRPFLGVRFWRTVKGGQWRPALSIPAPLPLASPLPSAVTAPASAPKVSAEKVVPDTINGELVWPDPWDQISETPLRNY